MSKHIDWFKNLEVAVGKTFNSPAMMQIATGRIQLVDAGAGKTLVVNDGGELEEFKLPNYLCFTAQQDGSTITMVQVGTDASVYDLQVSFDMNAWEQYTLGNTITLNNGEKVYWRGNNVRFGVNVNIFKRFTMTGKLAASGNINSLLIASGFDKIMTLSSENCFYGLFEGCEPLTSAPELPATVLSYACYSKMFARCKSLQVAPKLPATTLANNCYYGMF